MSAKFYRASDYAGLSTDGVSFYYGYEATHEGEDFDKDEENYEWCFQATDKQDRMLTIPFSELGADDMFDVIDCLMIGIGTYLETLKLALGKSQLA